MPCYDLTYLIEHLKKYGLSRWCLKYTLSADKSSMQIVYLDYLLNEQFIFIFRTSRLAYRIFYNNKLISKKTCMEAFNYIKDILNEIICNVAFYDDISVAELRKTDKFTANRLSELRGIGFMKNYRK